MRPIRNSTRRWGKLVLVAVAIAVPTALVISYLPALLHSDPPEQSLLPPPGEFPNTPFFVPGIRTPTAKSAREANVPDDEQIIGVATNGHHRAYRVIGMGGVGGHVVNDLIEGMPVTVTYCDRNDCSQVFTGEQSGQPLDVSTGGWYGGLLLKIEDRYFLQATDRIVHADDNSKPVLPILPHTRTTWKQWRDTFPDTDIYLGPDRIAKP